MASVPCLRLEHEAPTFPASETMTSNEKIFARDAGFWKTYDVGRPAVPSSFFQKIFNYHAAKGGSFDVVHDVGAGNGPYATRLRARFNHVIVSDIAATNVELSRKRLAGLHGFSFRTAALEDSNDIETATLDMIFASNVMHFADPQDTAMRGLARQLKPGGTLAVAAFAPAHFHDPVLQELWKEIGIQGGRELMTRSLDQAATARVMARTEGPYNVAPLDRDLWDAEALRMEINMGESGIQPILPPEYLSLRTEPDYASSTDSTVSVQEPEWTFEMDSAGVMAHLHSFPFVSQFPDVHAPALDKIKDLLQNHNRVTGYFPVKLILATRSKE